MQDMVRGMSAGPLRNMLSDALTQSTAKGTSNIKAAALMRKAMDNFKVAATEVITQILLGLS